MKNKNYIYEVNKRESKRLQKILPVSEEFLLDYKRTSEKYKK